MVAFTKVLTIYQVYHTWIHPLHHSLLSLSPHSWNSFRRFHFSIYMDVYTIFPPYSHSHAFSPHYPNSHWYQPSRQDLFCPPVLWFCKRKKRHFCLFKISTQGFPLWHFHVYMHYNPGALFLSGFKLVNNVHWKLYSKY
jgi:hypothetical protein